MPVNLLWTGGWDSTFRLLQLLLTHEQSVVPHYLIDAERRSAGMELRAIKRIKDRLVADFPQAVPRLQPTRYWAVADIAPHAEITAAFHTIRRTRHIGDQYEWLARYCAQQGVLEMELSIHRDDIAPTAIKGHVIEAAGIGGVNSYGIDPAHTETPVHTVFSCFRFPLYLLSKLDMGRIAHTGGWAHLLELSWFCHWPTRSGKPCGTCLPCRFALEEGMGRRIPPVRRALGLVYWNVLVPARGHLKRLMGRG